MLTDHLHRAVLGSGLRAEGSAGCQQPSGGCRQKEEVAGWPGSLQAGQWAAVCLKILEVSTPLTGVQRR